MPSGVDQIIVAGFGWSCGFPETSPSTIVMVFPLAVIVEAVKLVSFAK
jgi:hypothetical protein